jgi:hypothetical protein
MMGPRLCFFSPPAFEVDVEVGVVAGEGVSVTVMTFTDADEVRP